MHPHERQYIDALVNLAAERFVERLMHRAGSARAARAALAADPEAPAVGVGRFVRLFFADMLLDSPAGACVVLQALADRAPAPAPPAQTIAAELCAMAERAFAAVLVVKAEEALDRAGVYEPADPTEVTR